MTVQIELLLPSQIEAALAKRSVVYMPLGTLEFHGAHLPIGLDSLTAHGLCIEAARRDGGLVCPPLYFGTGGGHGRYPWTIMVESAELAPLIERTLLRLQDFGVETVVLFSGHFAGEQIALIEETAARWQAMNKMRVKALAVNMAKNVAFAPDHAAAFETTLLGAMWPDLVHIELLPPLETTPSIDPDGNTMGTQRHDPAHPLYGIFGPDPRFYDPHAGPVLLNAMVNWIITELD
jgi:creatinine amidohydrolase